MQFDNQKQFENCILSNSAFFDSKEKLARDNIAASATRFKMIGSGKSSNKSLEMANLRSVLNTVHLGGITLIELMRHMILFGKNLVEDLIPTYSVHTVSYESTNASRHKYSRAWHRSSTGI